MASPSVWLRGSAGPAGTVRGFGLHVRCFKEERKERRRGHPREGGRGRGLLPPRAEETEDGRTDGERGWKKVVGKVSRVFHSADSACFQALEIAAAAVAAAVAAEEAELVIISSCLQGERSLLANHQLFIKHFEPIKH